MDSRHESYEQEVVNKFIHVINANLDKIVQNKTLSDELAVVLQYIYNHVAIEVNVVRFLAKKNTLSNDVVFLPEITEASAFNQAEKEREMFTNLIKELKILIEYINSAGIDNKELNKRLIHLTEMLKQHLTHQSGVHLYRI